jgi:hypothetical protein
VKTVKTIQTYSHTIQPHFYTNTTSFTYVFIAKKASMVVSTIILVLITLGFFFNVSTTIGRGYSVRNSDEDYFIFSIFFFRFVWFLLLFLLLLFVE